MLCFLAGCDAPTPPPAVAASTPLGFVGSATCQGCHAPQFDLWQASHHALAMQPATSETVLGDFTGAEFEYFDTTTTFFTQDGKFMVRTDNEAGDLEDFEVKYTFGVTPLQQYLVELPNGHVQALQISWDTRSTDDGGQRWYHLYPDEVITSEDPLHWTGREMNWNYMCAECHSTDLQKNYSVDSASFATTWSEMTVGCEACHGPASRHVVRARSGSGSAGLTVDLDDSGNAIWRMNLSTGIAERSELAMQPPSQPEACGRCHSRRSVATADYEFGKPLHDTHRPALLDEFLYYPDGQILEEVYVYGSFVQSRMYQAGVSCSDCHDPHSARLKSGGSPSEICSTCHLPEKFSSTDHHRHEPVDVGCVDCHMVARTYMGVDGRRDHSFRIPRPDLTISTGSPNACNQCHDDREPGWALDAVQAWYGESRPEHYATAIHAGRSDSPLANELLLAAIRNSQYPGIARATSLSLLRPPHSPQALAEIRGNLSNADSLVRAAALGALENAAPDLIVQLASSLLTDPIRSVRIEAASVLSPLQASLAGENLFAFRRANEERRAAQFAIAERPEAHMNLGNLYMDAGNVEQADAAFRHALRLEPQAIAARVNLAELHTRSANVDEAERILREGIALDANDAILRHSLGLLLVRGERREAALAELAAAASLQPEEPRFVYVYAVALNSMERPDEAIDVLRRAVGRFPTNFDIHWALATMLRDQGETEAARNVAAALLEIYPQVEAVRNLLQSL